MIPWPTVLDFSKNVTHRVGQRLLSDFGKVQAMEKADGSLVTQADQWSDQTLREAIAQQFPSHGVLSEEGQQIFPDQDWVWIIDPLDGTTNFARGIPLWGVSLGLLYQGTPVFGYIHFPTVNQSFHGFWPGDSGLEMPHGAFLNDQVMHTSGDDPSGNHFFNLCARSTAVLKTQPFPCKIRMLGVATYNVLMVAAGASLGGVEATPKIWDIAGVWVIAQAAGASWVPLSDEAIFPLVSGQDYATKPFPTLVTSRADLVPFFQPLVEFLGQ